MKKNVIFEGKVFLGDQEVDFRIYKVDGDKNMPTHFEYGFNPQVKDEHQVCFHLGESLRDKDLENLLYKFKNYKNEFTHVVEKQINPNF